MTLRNHFHSFLDNVRQEGRYRTFIDLERQVAGRPTPSGAVAAVPARSSFGAPTIISGWDATPWSSMP
jgi:hypothetical protein